MILIAESGSSKTDWRFWANGKVLMSFRTRGYNPTYLSSDEIQSDFLRAIAADSFDRSLKEFYFYGSGCSTEARCKIIQDAFKPIFPNAKMFVHHDMLGAGIAAWGADSGLVGILGTGSNCSFYKQGEIVKSAPSFGFLFGDEGGGVDLAKHFFNDYFKSKLPEKLNDILEAEYGLDRSGFLDKIYSGPSMNRSLAAFCPFFSKHIEDPYIAEMIDKRFQAYVNNWVKIYPEHKTYPIKLIGSIASSFKKEIEEVLERNNIAFGGYIQQPINHILNYHVAGKS